MPPFRKRPLLARRLERLLERVNGLGSPALGVSAPGHAPITSRGDPLQPEIILDASTGGHWADRTSNGPSNAPAAVPLNDSAQNGAVGSPVPLRGARPTEAVVEREGLIRRIGRLLGWK